LADYVTAFRGVATRRCTRAHAARDFRSFAIKLLMNAAGRYRSRTVAWCEIMLDAARRPETCVLARHWFAQLGDAWLDIATALHVDEPQSVVQPAMDTVIGLLFVILPLALSEAKIRAVLVNGADAGEVWRVRGDGDVARERAEIRHSRKAYETRERILSGAIDLLMSDGAAAVTYRAVALRAGLTPAAPAYYFQSIDMLLNAAQARLFEESKQRYRQAMAGAGGAAMDRKQLIDLTTTIFVREATEFGRVNVANYSLWLEAARHCELRPMIWNSIEDQRLAWRRRLGHLNPRQRPLDAVLAESLYLGKSVRLLASGAATSDLAGVRAELEQQLGALLAAEYWL
jgi:DNA-binding transcriptional regulator YbjK